MFLPHKPAPHSPTHRRPSDGLDRRGGGMDGEPSRKRGRRSKKRAPDLNGSVDSVNSLTPNERENTPNLPIYDVFRAAVVDKHGRPTTHCYELRRIEEPIETQKPITESELKKRGFVNANGREFSGNEIIRALEVYTRSMKKEKDVETPAASPPNTTPTPPAPRVSRWDQKTRERPTQKNQEKRQSTRDDDRGVTGRLCSGRSRSPVRPRRRLSTNSPDGREAIWDRHSPRATSRRIEARGSTSKRREEAGKKNEGNTGGRERQFFRNDRPLFFGSHNQSTSFRPPPTASIANIRPLNADFVKPPPAFVPPPSLPPSAIVKPKEKEESPELPPVDSTNKLKAGEDVPTPFGKLHWPPPENPENKVEEEGKAEEVIVVVPEKTARLPSTSAFYQPAVFDPTRPPPPLPLGQPVILNNPNRPPPVATIIKSTPKCRVANNPPPRQPATRSTSTIPSISQPTPLKASSSTPVGQQAGKKTNTLAQPSPFIRPQSTFEKPRPLVSITPPPQTAAPPTNVDSADSSEDEAVPVQDPTAAEKQAILEALKDMKTRTTAEERMEVITRMRRMGLFRKFLDYRAKK